MLAKKQKNDEFYTRYSDIEEEVSQYKKQLEGKIIYCNCDHPHKSNFVKFFVDNFSILKLKMLYATGCGVKYSFSYDGIKEKTNMISGNGDFRSQECLDILSQSDIVITNPPFSLFREYLKLLINSGKQFLILGNQNEVICKDIIQMLIEKKFWFGHKKGKLIFNSLSGTKDFGNIRWFTNLIVTDTKFLELTCKYTSNHYSNYDNYDAINVDKVEEMPYDYSGVMGVPISFLDKWNPKQFEILGVTRKKSF